MKISSFLLEHQIVIGIKHKRKCDIFKELLSTLKVSSDFSFLDFTKIVALLVDREKLGSTAIGQGVAIPHVRIEGIKMPVLIVGTSSDGIDFDSLDGELVHVFFLILSPRSDAGMHLKFLANISKLLRDQMFVQKIVKVKTSNELLTLIVKKDLID